MKLNINKKKFIEISTFICCLLMIISFEIFIIYFSALFSIIGFLVCFLGLNGCVGLVIIGLINDFDLIEFKDSKNK